MDGGSINFSAQCADQCRQDEHGIEDVLRFVGMPLPDMYSMQLSLFVLEAGVRLLERERFDLMYLSLTDYVQHKHARGAEANRFYQALDDMFARLDALGAVVALTADHGMNDKSRADGSPNVIWLQDRLDESVGRGRTIVICRSPTGSWHTMAPSAASSGSIAGMERRRREVMQLIEGLPGIDAVLEKEDAARRFELPLDREGDIVVISDAGTCIGGARADRRPVRPRRTPAAHARRPIREPRAVHLQSAPEPGLSPARRGGRGQESKYLRVRPQRARQPLTGQKWRSTAHPQQGSVLGAHCQGSRLRGAELDPQPHLARLHRNVNGRW